MPITINVDPFSETLTKCNDENKVHYAGRYHLKRVSFFAVIVPPIREGDFQYRSLSDAQQAALDSQGGGQVHQMDAVEVLTNLMQISRTLLPGQEQKEFVIETLHAVVPQHLVLLRTPLHSYYQFCYRAVQLVNHHNGVCFGQHSSRFIKPPHTGRLATWQMAQLVCDHPGAAFGVHWLAQLDFVDLHRPHCLDLGDLSQRRWECTACTSSVRSSGTQHTKYRGVRNRKERHKPWVAEMKPPKRQKESFGSYTLEVEAARAVDAAYHYYDKPQLLNFQDSPTFLPPVSSEGLSDETAKLAFVKIQAKKLAERALDSPSMEEPANRALSGVSSLENRPEEVIGGSSSTAVVHSFRAGSWSGEDGVDKASNSELMTHSGVAAILSMSNLQSEYVSNAQPISSTVQCGNFTLSSFEDFTEEIPLETNGTWNHKRLTQQDNFRVQITEEGEFAITNELDLHMAPQLYAFTPLNGILHQQSVELDHVIHTSNGLDIPLGHRFFTNTYSG